MRLRRVLIERYGCFDRAELAFAAEPGRINLVVAPNGAGKSVLRLAFHDLLFDIPLQTPMKFRHGYPGMALHADALASDGADFSFGWSRQGKPQRITTDPTRFAALRREITPQQLDQLFALDTAGLRKGGTDLKGGTTLAAALLAGTGELAPAKAVRAEIEARRQANWGSGKSKPPLNAAIAALANARKSALAAVQGPQQRDSQERELERQRRVHAAARQDHEHALATTRQLYRIALTRPHLLALSEAAEWLGAHPDAPALPAGLDIRLAGARATVATARATQMAAQQAHDAAAAAAAAIERDIVAAQHAERLGRLPGLLGETGKAVEDMRSLAAERTTALGLAGVALRDIDRTVQADQAGALIPPAATMAEARTAITEHAGLRKSIELAEARLRKADHDRREAERETATVTPAPEGLSALLQEIRADRNPVQHAADIAGAQRDARAGLRAALAQVPGWNGPAEALRALAPATDAAYERQDNACRDARAEHRDRQAARDRLGSELASTSADLASLREQELPDTAAIAAARAERDRGWQLVLRRAFSADGPDVAAEREYGGAEPLPLAYERRVRTADTLADRRSTELDRVTEADRLARRTTELEGLLAAATVACGETAARLAAAQAAWSSACAPSGLGADATMAELRGFLAGRTRVVEALSKAEIAADASASLASAHAGWAGRLAVLLEAPGQALPALLALGDARMAKAQAAMKAATRQQAQLDAARREQQEAEAKRGEAKVELHRWDEAWTDLLARIGRPAGEQPGTTAAMLDRIAVLDRHVRDAASLATRIAAMQSDLDRFAEGVADLAAAMGEAAGSDAASTARALVARAARAAALESAWTEAQASMRRSGKALETANGQLREALAELGATVAAAGADDPQAADARIAAGREHARSAMMRDAALAALREHGDGQSRAALEAEAAAVPPEAMEAAREAAEAAASDAGTRAEQAAVKLDQQRTASDADASTTAALDTRADYEAAAADYSRRLEEQLVLNVASAMLAQAMETVEQELGGSSLARVSDAFSAVTGSAYGIAVDRDSEALYAVEHAYPRERKDLHELSEGTRDQLYLALRMVALRDHCAGAAPLPFIADDILQTFDDDRARAALCALVELSADLQVIVLTHHPHLVQIARTLPADSVNILRL